MAAYPFVSTVHLVGRAVTPSEDRQLYDKFSRWDNKTQRGRNEMIECKKFYDSWWPEVYHRLRHVVTHVSRPDFIFSDYQVEAARDVAQHCCIPLATMWPQMPWLMVPHSWIPGEPGTQVRCLTSEHASMWDRLYDQTYLLRYAPQLLHLFLWTRSMRKQAGVHSMPSLKPKPENLVLVNSFWGLEPAKDVPPLLQPVGPLLSDSYAPLDVTTDKFLDTKTSVVYVAFGTHVILTSEKVDKLMRGLCCALEQGSIDGVIWALRGPTRDGLDPERLYPAVVDGSKDQYTVGHLLANQHPSWLILEHAPQRAVLDHPSTTLFVTHAGPSSANEALFHGIPMVSMPFYGDQIQHNLRLVAAGVAKNVDKDTFTPAQLASTISAVLLDTDGEIGRNVRRMQRIAHVGSRRKHLAADLIEEYMYDWGLRFELDPAEQSMSSHVKGLNGGRGRELSPMHLQTADARMSRWRANNYDQWLLLAAVVLCAIGTTVLARGHMF